ncbi:MAG: carbohydrate hydrolase [Sulfobacillus acidophilus]|uniref:Carbohydrate hydrolase n=1 Tax=Sulfobacillus acidophilus TaxID=53633 RepID=A0A2T2WK04_9FIRM|nr:MAG: carbohydrate hydrolase [Sulfobacillus acidophilus]
MTFMGYWRPDGRAGTRNHVLLLPLAPAVSTTAMHVEQIVPGTVAVELHQDIGPELPGWTLAVRTLRGWIDHPNVYGAVLLALSAQDPVVEAIVEGLPPSARWQVISFDEAGGRRAAETAAVAIAREWAHEAQNMVREPIPVRHLLLATECGGSDACSGLSANPSLGYASDLLIQQGGTSILAETTELIGAEGILAARARTPAVAEAVWHTVAHAEHAAMRMGVDFRGGQPAPGNMAGGITTIEEKSLGCVHKGGTSPVVDVVDYAERPTRAGLVVMDTPGHDVMQFVGMAAAGAQVIVFTTGRGTPTGAAIAPVIKVSTRTDLKHQLPDLIDFDAGPVIDGYLTVEQVGEALWRKIRLVASGELVAAERWGHREFGVFPGWEAN